MPEAAYAAVIAGVLAAAWVAWRWTRSRPLAMKQFARDLVEHPDYHERSDEEHERLLEAMDEAEAAPPPSPAELPRLIDDLLSHEDRRVRVARNRLEKVSTEAEQLLLAALSDPRATWTPDQTEVGESSPAQRLSRLLAAIPSRLLGERIGHMAEHPDWRVNSMPIEVRTALGRAHDLPFVLGKLAEQNKNAQDGVELAIKRGWAEPAFIEGVRDWAERTTLDESLPFSHWAVGFYAKHGGPKAIEALCSPRILSVSNNRNLHSALQQLNRHGIRLEREVIKPLLDKALAYPDTGVWTVLFAPALRAFARSDPDSAARLAEIYLDRPESSFHHDSIDLLREMAGFGEFYEIEPPADLPLTDAEKRVLDDLIGCSHIFGEVCNGGLSQYFFNSTGSHWPRHVAALRAIGFEKGAEAVEEASRLIHAHGASLDRDERIAQYDAKLSDRKEKRLDELSKLFYSKAPRLRFMLRHKELFVRIRTARIEAGLDAATSRG